MDASEHAVATGMEYKEVNSVIEIKSEAKKKSGTIDRLFKALKISG